MTRVTVTGPDCDRKAESGSLGLSLAVTYASRASRGGRSASYYVRDQAGELVGRADADGAGQVEVWGPGAINAYRVAQLPLPDRSDRAPTNGAGAATRPVVDGRPSGPTHEPTEVIDMAATKKSPSRGTAAKQATKKSTTPRRRGTPAEALHAEVKKLSAKQATVQVLAAAGEPLKADEIAKRVLETDGVKLGGKTPAATIAAMLAVENKKADGLFVRTDKATYRLREQPQAEPVEAPQAEAEAVA